MAKRLPVSLTILFLSAIGLLAQPLTSASKRWTPLFPGDSLKNWEVVPVGDGGGKWQVENGILKVTRQPPERGAAWLVSRKDYEDFLLRVKFRPNGTDYVTGLLIRDPGHARIGAPAFNGYEVVMQRSPTRDNMDGSIYHVANAYDIAAAPDGWTEIEVHCIGDHLTVFVNGKKTSEAHSRRSFKGAIGFHLHRGDNAVNWEFKDAEIKELPPAPHGYQLLEERLSADPHPLAPLFQSLENDFAGNSANAWSWKDGVLTATGGSESSVLITRESISDFVLDFEFKIVKGGNAGVLFRVPPHGSAKSYEFHIADPIEDNPTGSVFNLARAFSVDRNNRPIVQSGQWTRGRIFVAGDHIVTYINSEKGAEIHDARFSRGQIGFRVGPASSIQFRKVLIKRLDDQH